MKTVAAALVIAVWAVTLSGAAQNPLPPAGAAPPTDVRRAEDVKGAAAAPTSRSSSGPWPIPTSSRAAARSTK